MQIWEVAAMGTLTRNLHPPSQEKPEEQSCKTRVQKLCKAPPAEQSRWHLLYLFSFIYTLKCIQTHSASRASKHSHKHLNWGKSNGVLAESEPNVFVRGTWICKTQPSTANSVFGNQWEFTHVITGSEFGPSSLLTMT